MDHAVERQLQKEYWQEHTVVLSVEAMMLDSQAAKLDKEERPEILASLPPIDGKSILELGAGIGRFTRELAMKASHVTACDFMENAIKKNEETNGHMGNIKFVCADVTSDEMDFPPASVDIVFSNWLLMYLSDEEVKELAERMVKWVKKGGYVFFRESCFHKSGDNKRKFNPTHYRQPTFYTKVFQECHVKEEDMVYSELRLVSCKCVGAYVRNKYNQNQICWLWQKVESSSPEDKNFQRFLDTVQYSQKGIQLYERIFGKGFVSTGGIDTTKEFVKRLDLQPNQKVLDIGCGVGGSDFYMAETYGVEVLGIDLSINMVSIALENAIGRHCNAQFEVADCTKEELPSETFDVIYSRDAILHIQDKPALFKRMYNWLKPGGKVLISDYSRAEGSLSEEFNQYILHRGYDLHDMESYSQMLRDAGFTNLIAEDRTEQFIDILEKQLRTMEQERDLFVSDFCKEDYEAAVEGWKSKLKRSRKGEQRWCLFFATKSLKPKLNST